MLNFFIVDLAGVVVNSTQKRTTILKQTIQGESIIHLIDTPGDLKRAFQAIEKAVYQNLTTLIKYHVSGMPFIALAFPVAGRKAGVVEAWEGAFESKKLAIKLLWKNYFKYLGLK